MIEHICVTIVIIAFLIYCAIARYLDYKEKTNK